MRRWTSKVAQSGDPTEVAMFRAAQAAGCDRRIEEANSPRVGELPFDSNRKCMTTVHRRMDGAILSITKGAPEVVIDRCVREARTAGPAGIDHERLQRAANDMASDGMRVLAIGVRSLESLPPVLNSQALEQGLEFVGLIGFLDPPRPEAREAIDICKSAGIVPVMITGDHPATARAIAVRLGVLADDGMTLTGTQLAELSPDQLRGRVRDVRVYARVEAEQKLKIVTALQDRGEIVAMTGDGVNDAPALRQADIGIAMGIAGTDVAKEASAIVLLDDNFATIVSAVREGRRIYDNIRRFVRYVLTTIPARSGPSSSRRSWDYPCRCCRSRSCGSIS